MKGIVERKNRKIKKERFSGWTRWITLSFVYWILTRHKKHNFWSIAHFYPIVIANPIQLCNRQQFKDPNHQFYRRHDHHDHHHRRHFCHCCLSREIRYLAAWKWFVFQMDEQKFFGGNKYHAKEAHQLVKIKIHIFKELCSNSVEEVPHFEWMTKQYPKIIAILHWERENENSSKSHKKNYGCCILF